MAMSDKPEPECNGICLSGADIGVPYGGIAYPHPDCPAHGDFVDDNPELEVCGDGDEDCRYIREEDMAP